MTNLAPRQGLFALVVFASFCLHIFIFVITGTSKENTHNAQYATALAKQLGSELELPLSIGDPVGASVIASRHSQDPAIAYIGVFDKQDRLIAPIGNQDATQDPISQDIGMGQTVGKVIIKTATVSRTRVFLDYWQYLFCVLVLHLFVWLAYGNIARPNDEYEKRVRDEVRKKLIANGIPLENEPTQPPPKDPHSINPSYVNISAENDKKRGLGGLFDMFKTKDNEDETPTPAPTPSASVSETGVPSFFADVKPQEKPKHEPFSFYTSNNQKVGESLYIQLAFVDDNNLIEMLSESSKQNYLGLCNQLIDKATEKVLARPLLAGVRLDSIQHFENKDGKWVAHIKINRNNNYARLALAGAMLVKLLPAIHQVVYDRHRELGQFALPIKAIASDETRREGAMNLLQKRKEPSLLLLNSDDTNSLASHFGLARHKEANGLYEKECRIITYVNSDMMKQLTDVRNAVLLQD